MPYPTLPEYLFVDGAYLREILVAIGERYCDGAPLDMNYSTLFSPHEKVFYYDCLPPRRSGETGVEHETRLKEVRTHFAKLRRLPGCHVFEGKTSYEGKVQRQKGIDVHIAVHMLMHVVRKNTMKVTLFAGDADFLPLVQALVLEGAQVTVVFESRSAAVDLIRGS